MLLPRSDFIACNKHARRLSLVGILLLSNASYSDPDDLFTEHFVSYEITQYQFTDESESIPVNFKPIGHSLYYSVFHSPNWTTSVNYYRAGAEVSTTSTVESNEGNVIGFVDADHSITTFGAQITYSHNSWWASGSYDRSRDITNIAFLTDGPNEPPNESNVDVRKEAIYTTYSLGTGYGLSIDRWYFAPALYLEAQHYNIEQDYQNDMEDYSEENIGYYASLGGSVSAQWLVSSVYIIPGASVFHTRTIDGDGIRLPSQDQEISEDLDTSPLTYTQLNISFYWKNWGLQARRQHTIGESTSDDTYGLQLSWIYQH